MKFIKRSKQIASETNQKAEGNVQNNYKTKRFPNDELKDGCCQPAKKKIRLEMKIGPRKFSNFSCSDISVSSIRYQVVFMIIIYV